MRYGDPGHLFYIVLKGRVSVIVPRNPAKAMALKLQDFPTNSTGVNSTAKLDKDDEEEIVLHSPQSNQQNVDRDSMSATFNTGAVNLNTTIVQGVLSDNLSKMEEIDEVLKESDKS